MVESIKELRKICYEGRNGPLPFYNKYIGTKVSIYITKVLLYTPITANQVTFMMLLLGIIGSVFLFNGFFLLGLAFIHLSVILDDVDGEIARYRKKTSMLGMHLDTIYHYVTSYLMIFAFAYGTYNLYPNKLLIIFGFISAIFTKSVVLSALFDTIAIYKIRGIKPPPFRSKINKERLIKEMNELEGKTKKYESSLLMIFNKIKDLWKAPSDVLLLTALYAWEMINLNYGFVEPYFVTLIFFVVFGCLVTIVQIVSLWHHLRKYSIEKIYVLFDKEQTKFEKNGRND